ncbi:hypothetical protein ACET3Z_019180 [Daucus carota]
MSPKRKLNYSEPQTIGSKQRDLSTYERAWNPHKQSLGQGSYSTRTARSLQLAEKNWARLIRIRGKKQVAERTITDFFAVLVLYNRPMFSNSKQVVQGWHNRCWNLIELNRF